MTPAKGKPDWSIEEKTKQHKAKVNVWADGTADYTLSRPAGRGLMDFVLSRKVPWATERKQFNLRDPAALALPSQIQRLLRRLNLPRDLRM